MYAALGNVQVPTPIPGNFNRIATVRATGYNYCGDVRGLQQMLADLGWYKGMIDGNFGRGSRQSAEAAAREYGVPFIKGGTINNAFCQAVMDAWVAQNAPSPSPAPPKPPPGSPSPTEPAPLPSPSEPASSPGGEVAPTSQGGGGGGITGWWNQQDKNTKIAIGLGAVGIVGLGVYLLATPKRA